ncbi:hypothetical protein OROGR_006246 [Orobanche gracilis]
MANSTSSNVSRSPIVDVESSAAVATAATENQNNREGNCGDRQLMIETQSALYRDYCSAGARDTLSVLGGRRRSIYVSGRNALSLCN